VSIHIFCYYMNIEAHYLKYDSRHLSRLHTFVYIYIHACVCAFGRRSASVCVCLFFFFLSISIDAIAQNEGEKRGKERKFDDDDVYSMASCIYIEKKKKAQKSVWKKEIMHITSFFSSLLFYSLSCSLSLSSANCMYKQ
jgi:hypothetical protein